MTTAIFIALVLLILFLLNWSYRDRKRIEKMTEMQKKNTELFEKIEYNTRK